MKVSPDDFMPLKLLGKGSFGEVYLVRQIGTDTLYAMKVLIKSKILGQILLRYAKTDRDVLSYTVHKFIGNFEQDLYSGQGQLVTEK